MNAGYPDRSFPDNLHRLICSILIINLCDEQVMLMAV